MIAAIGMGKAVLPPPATFDAAIMAVAMVSHFVLYHVNFYGFTAIFPWFAMGRAWVTILSHIVFGLVTAAAYLAMASGVDRGPVATPVR